ncbi:MAG: ribonuclease III [Rhizobiaceae bacterium]
MEAARVSAQKIAELEERIGHSFKTHERLVRALTHSSATKKAGDISHYERLEFLGDRVLGLCVAELLFFEFPQAREGELSVRLNALVSGNTCAEIADEIGVHVFIHAGADVKHIASKRMRSVRADVVESLIAAIYLDGGLESAKKFVSKYWQSRIHEAGAGIRDSKTALQEWAHIEASSTPLYNIASRAGPDHDPIFTVEVVIEGAKGATGSGRSKRSAEQDAAQTILLREGVWIQTADGTIKENNK